MRELIDARSSLTAYQLPPHAPDLDPVEGVWPHLKRSLANPAKHCSISSPRWCTHMAEEDAVPGLASSKFSSSRPPLAQLPAALPWQGNRRDGTPRHCRVRGATLRVSRGLGARGLCCAVWAVSAI
ncbi:hypothetical protein AB0H82_10535 [Streptomyces sp. NPDC050732]|uniref:hypothetical protein n=1 Tax=Streptomyces sp. NPDC050732 TaxID=3154632 RepID=UPI00343473DB